MRAVGNIIAGNELDFITALIVNGQLFDKMLALIVKLETQESYNRIKECLWTLSNIACGNTE